MPESGPTEVGAQRHLTTFALWWAAGAIAVMLCAAAVRAAI